MGPSLRPFGLALRRRIEDERAAHHGNAEHDRECRQDRAGLAAEQPPSARRSSSPPPPAERFDQHLVQACLRVGVKLSSRAEEALEIVGGRDDRACGPGRGRARDGHVREALPDANVAVRVPTRDLRLRVEAGAAQVQRHEDPLSELGSDRVSGRLLDDQSDQDVARVAVGLARPRSEVRLVRRREPDHSRGV